MIKNAVIFDTSRGCSDNLSLFESAPKTIPIKSSFRPKAFCDANSSKFECLWLLASRRIDLTRTVSVRAIGILRETKFELRKICRARAIRTGSKLGEYRFSNWRSFELTHTRRWHTHGIREIQFAATNFWFGG